MHTEKANFRSSLSLFLMVFPPVALLIAALGVWHIHEQKSVILEGYQVEARHHVEGQMNRVHRFYKQGISMLLALVHNRSLNTAVAGNSNARREVAEVFRDVMNASDMYDQIRLLDSAGREVVRVDRRGDSPYVVPTAQLQEKGRRNYVRQTLKLPEGAVYVSPFDLNMEHGMVERPYKAVIRLATPLMNGNGIKSGVLVINILGISMMQRELSETVLEGEHLLINAGSPYWFDRHVDELHVLEDMHHVTQQHRLSEDWMRVFNEDKGQFATDEGQFTFESMKAVSSDMTTHPLILPQWQIVSFVPAAALIAAQPYNTVLLVVLVMLVLSGVTSWVGAGWLVNRKIFLQQLRRSEARFRHLVEASIDPMVIHRLGSVMYANPAGVRLIGAQSPDEIVGTQVLEYIHPDDRPVALERLRQLDRDGAYLEPVEERCRRLDGQWITIEVVSCPFEFEGQPSVLTMGHDITERKQAEQQREALLQTNRRLAQGLIRAREDERTMLARALHDDIGQKLTAIQMQAAAVTGQCSDKNCPAAKRGMRIIQEMAAGVIETVRGQLKRLRPPQLDDLGLKAALGALCADWKDHGGVHCRLNVDDAVDTLDNDV